MIRNIITRLKGGSQEEAGYEYGKTAAEEKEITHNMGSILIDELQKKKKKINNEENCIKCRRTRRNRCKKHERMLLGLDALAGEIAQKYLDEKPKYLQGNN